jgi:uncharacterized repeat protein (TIGR03803 family)
MRLPSLKGGCAIFAFFAAIAIPALAQTFHTVALFDGTNGNTPSGPAVQAPDGNFYGTTDDGGANAAGNIFKIGGDRLLNLYSFNFSDGLYPQTGLILSTDGNLYGTTLSGGTGAGRGGTVFKITPGGRLTTLYNFCTQRNCTDGLYPSGLVQSADGSFYGVTGGGGDNANGKCSQVGCGIVFRITSDGAITTLYNFCAKTSCADGYAPNAGLIQASDGKFYGTTGAGGANGLGTIFRITRSGVLTTIYSFCSQPKCSDGAQPESALIQAGDGDFYGTTYYGGTTNEGTVYRITQEGRLTTLHSFQVFDGAKPVAALVQGTNGSLYGTTEFGGMVTGNCSPDGCGTIYEISSSGKLRSLHSFDGFDGIAPASPLIQSTHGLFYGTTSAGGRYTYGTVFSLDMGLGPFVAFVRSYGKVGQTGGILGQGFTGTTSVSLNGTPADFTVVSDTFIKATVPPGATTGYVTVMTPSGTLTSNVPFRVLP